MLDKAYTAAKTTQGDMADEVETLCRVTGRMLATINKGLQIDRDRPGEREQAVTQLGEVRAKLMEGLRPFSTNICRRAARARTRCSACRARATACRQLAGWSDDVPGAARRSGAGDHADGRAERSQR